MQHYTGKDLQELEKTYRRNLVNSATGYKSANLIATFSHDGSSKVAVFNSVFHLGSNPPLIGIALRSTTIPKGFYDDMREQLFFTVNHIQENMIEQAHRTAESESSGFEGSGLEEEFLDGFKAPYVKQSAIRLGCRFLNEYQVRENNCLLVVAGIEHIYLDSGIEMPDGWLRLEDAGSVVINGIDAYSLPSLLDRFHYARPGEEITSFFRDPEQ